MPNSEQQRPATGDIRANRFRAEMAAKRLWKLISWFIPPPIPRQKKLKQFHKGHKERLQRRYTQLHSFFTHDLHPAIILGHGENSGYGNK